MKCAATNRHGKPCARPAFAGGRYCWSHGGRARPGPRNARPSGFYFFILTEEGGGWRLSPVGVPQW